MVWCLRLYADTEGSSLISCAAWLHRDSRPWYVPSWHTIVCISDHVCLPPDMRTADFCKPFIYHMVKVDIGKYRGQYGTL